VILVSTDNAILRPIAGASDGTDSTHFRGLLAATLSSLEWASLNCRTNTKKRIHSSSDAIYRHLPDQIGKWVGDPNRVNHDLIVKVHAALGKLKNISFLRVATEDALYGVAKALADDAADRRASEPSTMAYEEEEMELDDLRLIDDNDWLYQRALSRDP
jgi:hypothetical protein